MFSSQKYAAITVKPVKNGHFQKDKKLVFKINYRLMQIKGSILQYFRPLLSYHLSLRSLFCLFLSGHFFHRFYCTSSPIKFCYGTLEEGSGSVVDKKVRLPGNSFLAFGCCIPFSVSVE